ncbi:MAG: ThuA domain-containing protein [Opitutus sp.]
MLTAFAAPSPSWLEFSGAANQPGSGHRVVLISGDEEYRSEESMPMLAKILSQHHGFTCTVLFAIDPTTGIINPNLQTNIPGLKALAKADLLIIATRFRQLPAEQLRMIADYLQAGKPVIGLRTATHAFTGPAETDGLKWKEFGSVVLGETWVAHHGKHKVEGARGIIEPANADSPVLRGVTEVFGPSDVYTVSHLNPEAKILLRGEVTTSLAPDSPALEGEKNRPMMPMAWLRDYQVPGGKPGRAFCSTMGAAVDLLNEGLRRLIVNASYELTGQNVPERADVTLVDPFAPSFYGFVEAEAWVKRAATPADFALGQSTTPFDRVVIPAGYTSGSARIK